MLYHYIVTGYTSEGAARYKRFPTRNAARAYAKRLQRSKILPVLPLSGSLPPTAPGWVSVPSPLPGITTLRSPSGFYVCNTPQKLHVAR